MIRIAAAVRCHAHDTPHSVALRDAEREITYAELESCVAEVAREIACPPNEVVAIAMDNGRHWAIADLALLASGRVCLPLPPFFSSSQQVHALGDAGARLLLTDDPERYGAILHDAGSPATRRADCNVAGKTIAQFDLGNAAAALPQGTIKITYTSGTTGTPKGVCLGEEAIGAVTGSLVAAAALTRADRHLAALPLSTLLENVGGLYAPLVAGACTTLLPLEALGMTGSRSTSIDRLARALHSYEATTAITVPELLTALCAAIERGAPRIETLRFLAVGGARVAQALLDRATRAGLPVYEGYGLSECASVVAVNTPDAHRAGSVGRILPHARVEITADGEIHVLGPRFLGYVGTPETSRERGYATGDVGFLSREGFLYLSGRRKNMFITSYGRNVAPEWIEAELTGPGAIGQAWVHGEARPWNVAVITPRANVADAAVDAVFAEANARLPDYARVRRWLKSREPFSAANGQLTANWRLRRDVLLQAYGGSINKIYAEETSDVSR